MGFAPDGPLRRDPFMRRRAFSSGCLAGLGRLSSLDDCIRDFPEAGRGERPFLEDNLSLSRTSFVREVNKQDWDRLALRCASHALMTIDLHGIPQQPVPSLVRWRPAASGLRPSFPAENSMSWEKSWRKWF
jgi:hypothetical protein